MTKIKNWVAQAKVWWMLHFRNTLIREIEVGAYKVTFRRFYIEVATQSGNVKLRMDGRMEYPVGFMMSALDAGDYNVIHTFCNNVYCFIALHTCDVTLREDIQKAFKAWSDRMEDESEGKAKSISDDEDKLNEEVVNANIKVAKMTKKERKAHKEAIRKVIKKEDE